MMEAPRFTGKLGSLFTINHDEGSVQFKINQVFTIAHLEKLKKHSPKIGFALDTSGNKGTLNISALQPEEKFNMIIDLEFFEMNPNLPVENLNSRLSNYEPKNAEQVNFLNWAKRILELGDPTASAGIFAYGGPGVGKTHVSVGLAKEFLKKGENPKYINMSTNSKLSIKPDEIDKHSIWIIDDLNSPYGLGRELFISVLDRIHNKGGRIFVTSNMRYGEFMDTVKTLEDDAQFARIEDRIKGMIKPIFVPGISMRPDKAWFAE
jgi:DNA replication protein DnaC